MSSFFNMQPSYRPIGQQQINTLRPQWIQSGSPEKRSIVPRCDIVECDSCWSVYVDLVGASLDSLDCHIVDRQLSISADKCDDHGMSTMDNPSYVLQERNHGRFNRLLRIPQNVKEDPADVCFENGVLHMKFPKETAPGGKVKKLAIKGKSSSSSKK